MAQQGPLFSTLSFSYFIDMHQKDPDKKEGAKASKTSPPSPLKSDPAAGERLAAALRENLKRRKEQARGRKNSGGSEG